MINIHLADVSLLLPKLIRVLRDFTEFKSLEEEEEEVSIYPPVFYSCR
jgi:hypothetical protein